jgi:subtilisin family serine protease
VASVVDTLAPSADVIALRIADDGGVPTDVSTAQRVVDSFDFEFTPDFWPEIIVMPFGTPACDGLPPLALQMITEGIIAAGRSLIVASAGNRSSNRPFYPAAFDGVLAVGSLDLTTDRDANAWTSPTRAGPRSEFSNYGSWVDAWAGGERLVTHHVSNLAFYDGGPMLEGEAEVSGTSFAAPMVAALLAEGVALTGRPADWVWRNLLRPTGTRCPASGGGVAVALVSMRAPFFLPGLPLRRSPC